MFRKFEEITVDFAQPTPNYHAFRNPGHSYESSDMPDVTTGVKLSCILKIHNKSDIFIPFWSKLEKGFVSPSILVFLGFT